MNYEELKEKIEELQDYELSESEFDDIMDNFNDVVRIGRLEYSPSQVLKEIDNIAYRLGLSEEEDYRKSEAQEELQNELNQARDFEEITQEEYDELDKLLEEAY